MTKGMSQQELADKIEKTRPLVSHIEQTGQVSQATLIKIGKALGMDTERIETINDNQSGYYSSKQRDELYEKEISLLRDEIRFLKDLVQSQKEIISVLRMQMEKPEAKQVKKKSSKTKK